MSENTKEKQDLLVGNNPYVVLPEQSKDAVIQKLEVGEIAVDIVPEQVEQKNIQYEQLQLPPLPDELIEIQSENKGLKTAIEQLQSFTHESLQQANMAVKLAQNQFDAWRERKERLWKDLKQELREKLEKRIIDNPIDTEQSIDDLISSDMTNQQYFDFLEQFYCGEKYEQAFRELTRVQNERQEKCTDIIVQFQTQIDKNSVKIESILSTFLDLVLNTILASISGYNNLQAVFPGDVLLDSLRLLDKYELDWSARNIFSRARELWDETRPCVVEEQKQKEKAEAEQRQFEQRLLQFGPDDNKAGTRLVKNINGVEFVFRWCPAGTFIMGSPDERYEVRTVEVPGIFWNTKVQELVLVSKEEEGRYIDETQHKVTLTKGFWLTETEVTQKQWEAVVGTNPSHFKGEELPVECVSWNDCQIFCELCADLGFLVCLPTEAQWEYACRAGTTGPYAGDLDEMAWHNNNSNDKTHPVAMKKSNAWGLYDMHGNVWEWCADWYAKEHYGDDATDPVGPSEGTGRVFRGGGCQHDLGCRSAFRFSYSPGYRGINLGFRVVLKGE